MALSISLEHPKTSVDLRSFYFHSSGSFHPSEIIQTMPLNLVHFGKVREIQK